MRSADIVANCRETALRVEISGEWGGVADTLRGAADEIERLRRAVKSWERTSQLQLPEAMRMRLRPEEQEALIVTSIELHALNGFETNHSATLRGIFAKQGLLGGRPGKCLEPSYAT